MIDRLGSALAGIPGGGRRLFDRAHLALGGPPDLGTLLERLARIHGPGPLVEESDADAGGGPALRLSFAEGADRVARLAGGLRAALDGAPRRPRVVIHAANGYDTFLLCLAACRAGAVAVPVSAQATADEIAHVTGDCGAALTVQSAGEILGRPARAAPVAGVGGDVEGGGTRGDEVAAVFYTSGTTGPPKGAELSHAALVGGWTLGALYPSGLRRDEVVCGLPVAHIAGFTIVLAAAAMGVPVHLLRRFRPTDALDAIESRRATAFAGVPAMYRMMEEAGADHRDLRSVRLWVSGGDTMPPEMTARFQRRGAAATLPVVGSLGAAAFVDGYGMVELGGAVALKVSLPGLDLPLLPIPGSSLRVVDPSGREVRVGQVGELTVRSRGAMTDYCGRPDESAAVLHDGWLRTGDLARRGPLRLVTLAGRLKHVVKHGGYSVFTAEVERVLEQHPAVAEAAVVGLPDRVLGEVPAAAARLRPGASATSGELAAWAGEHLAAYKVPVRFRIVDELPRAGPGKVQKDRVRELLEP